MEPNEYQTILVNIVFDSKKSVEYMGDLEKLNLNNLKEIVANCWSSVNKSSINNGKMSLRFEKKNGLPASLEAIDAPPGLNNAKDCIKKNISNEK